MERKRAIIFANGEQIDLEAVRLLLRTEDFLIAADGGMRFLQRLGLQPHLLIGDLDSTPPELLNQVRNTGTVRVEQLPPDKDETDLELAVFAALREGCDALLILGGLGGRLDMTLANIFLLALPELEGVDARLEDGIEEVFLISPGEPGRVVEGTPGDRVSLLPFGGPASGVSTTGLYYPLRGETLYPERTRGISNRMVEPQAHITLDAGRLICIHTRLGSGDLSND